MSGPVVGSKELLSNPEAAAFHDAGLRAERSGDFVTAHTSFSEALKTLSGFDLTIDTDVQVARIVRDDGFTYVREAIAEPNDVALTRAERAIKSSAKVTARLLIDDALAQTDKRSKKVRREVLAEHGATVSLLGRLATVKQVLIRPQPGQAPEYLQYLPAIVGNLRFRQAHEDLRRGNNGYYRVNNAMSAARHERINHNSTAKWLGRATYGVAWTAVRDPRNILDAARTFGSRLRHVRSHQAAVKSVSVYP